MHVCQWFARLLSPCLQRWCDLEAVAVGVFSRPVVRLCVVGWWWDCMMWVTPLSGACWQRLEHLGAKQPLWQQRPGCIHQSTFTEPQAELIFESNLFKQWCTSTLVFLPKYFFVKSVLTSRPHCYPCPVSDDPNNQRCCFPTLRPTCFAPFCQNMREVRTAMNFQQECWNVFHRFSFKLTIMCRYSTRIFI